MWYLNDWGMFRLRDEEDQQLIIHKGGLVGLYG